MGLRVRDGWNERLREARESYAQRTGAGRKPSYDWLAEAIPEGDGRSASTIRRVLLDPGRMPPAALLVDLADALEVRSAWLLEGDGEMSEEMERERQEAVERQERLAALKERRGDMSPGQPFSPAARELFVELARRWVTLPERHYPDRKRPSEEEAVDQLRDLVQTVTESIPHFGGIDRRRWDTFTLLLLQALIAALPESIPTHGQPFTIDPETGWIITEQYEPKIARHEPTTEEDE